MSTFYRLTVQHAGSPWGNQGPERYDTKEEAQKAARVTRAKLKKLGYSARVFVEKSRPGES
jgi:hypothetical protein